MTNDVKSYDIFDVIYYNFTLVKIEKRDYNNIIINKQTRETKKMNTFELTKITDTADFREWVSSFYDYEVQFPTVSAIEEKYGPADTYRLAEEFYEEYNLEVWAIEEETIYVK